MFSEILKIIPRLDRAAAAAMENGLTKRFQRAARRFGQGIKLALKGTLFGIGASLLAKLINPLEEVEERIKRLLGQGEELSDLAQRFGGNAGSLMRVQAVGQAMGLSQEDLGRLMESFAGAVETGRKEVAARARDPKAEVSDATKILQNFLGETDLVEGFFKFIQSMARQNLSRDQRMRVETEVFGGAQHGAASRFLNADMAAVFAKLKLPAAGDIDAAAAKMAGLKQLQDLRQAQQVIDSFMKGSRNTGQSMIESMAAAERRKENKEISDILRFHEFANAAKGIEQIVGFVEMIQKPLLAGLTMLTDFIPKALEFFREAIASLGKLSKRFGLGGW